MLVLSRKKDESIRIQQGPLEPLIVTVLEATGRVRLGFEAPQETRILRAELCDAAAAGLVPSTPELLMRAATLLEGYQGCHLSNRSPVEAQTLRLVTSFIRSHAKKI